MKRTILLGLLCAVLCGCQPKATPVTTFGSDADFLRKYNDIILLSDEMGLSQVVVVPAYQGRVMTSTLDGINGMSFGWINRDLIALQRIQPHFNAFGGEDRLWLGPEGGQFSIFFRKGDPFDLDHWWTPASIDTDPFIITAADRTKAAFSRRCQFTNYSGTVFDAEIQREVRLLSREQVCRHLGLNMPSAPAVPAKPTQAKSSQASSPTVPTATPATAPAPATKPATEPKPTAPKAPADETTTVQPNFGPAPKPASTPATETKPVAKPAPRGKPEPRPEPKPVAKPVEKPKPVAPKPVVPTVVFLGPDVKVVAYESENKLVNLGREPWTKQSGMLSVWILGMMVASPTNTVVAPFITGPEDKLGPIVNDNYFVKVPSTRLKIGEGVIFFKADASMRTKIGLSPQRAKDVIGSYDAEHGVLTIVQYNKPSAPAEYVNSIWTLQKEPFKGEVLNSYSDGPDGFRSNFYELESSSPAAALQPNTSITHIHRTMHFQGPKPALDAIARKVLNASLDEIEKAFK